MKIYLFHFFLVYLSYDIFELRFPIPAMKNHSLVQEKVHIDKSNDFVRNATSTTITRTDHAAPARYEFSVIALHSIKE